MSKMNETEEPMYSPRVSKSEEEFLREFEAELAGDDLDDFWENFGNAMMESEEALDLDDFDVQEEGNPLDVFSADMPVEKKTITEESTSDSFSLGGVDLGALLSETTDALVQKKEESVSVDEAVSPFSEAVSPFDEGASPFDEAAIPIKEDSVMDIPAVDGSMDDVFSNLFGDSSAGGADMDIPLSSSSETIDLSNMGEADLMSLLAGDDGLSDIGNMLDGNANVGDGDAFAMFAEGEMSAQAIDEAFASEGDSKKKKNKKGKKDKKDKKGGFFAKLVEFLMAEDDEEEGVQLNSSVLPTAGQLADENADILAAFEGLEERPAKGTENKKKDKDKKKKEKKKKEKKPKKEKPKKEKKPKEPKPKKEKKPKEVDNTPPLPRGPVLTIWAMVISLFVLVMLSVNLFGYSSAVSSAKSYHNNGEYAKAYTELAGITIKEKDMLLYNQAATLAAVDSELNAFDSFHLAGKHEEALDSLVCAAGRCEVNADNAEVYECQGQMQILQAEVTNKLYETYGMTYEEALEIYDSKDRDDYSVAIYQKLRSLGLVE